MTLKTQGVHDLVVEVLGMMKEPYGKDIIEDVFVAIDANLVWLQRYNDLVEDLTKNVVNAWLGKYVKRAAGMENVKVVPAKRTTLTTRYTILTS